MSKIEMLREEVSRRLTAAVEEILTLCERAIAESEEENARLCQILHRAFNPEIRLHRADLPQVQGSPDVKHEEPEACLAMEEAQGDVVEDAHISISIGDAHDQEEESHTDIQELVLQLNGSPNMEEDELEPHPCTEVEPVSQMGAQHHTPPGSVKTEDEEVKLQFWQITESLCSNDTNDRASVAAADVRGTDTEKYGGWLENSTLGYKTELFDNKILNKDKIETDTPLACPNCCATFKHRGHLENHLQTHNATYSPAENRNVSSDFSFSCSLCYKSFTRKMCLNYHMKMHVSERPFGCSVCGQKFTQRGNLQRHEKMHMDDRPFRCKVCGQRFIRQSELKTHMRGHTGERPYQCPQCPKAFFQSGQLKTHIRSHTGEKPFSCPFCGERFNQRGNMKRHVRLHTENRQFSCAICGQKFFRMRDLYRHKKSHTGVKLYSCPVCSKLFKETGILKTHMRIHTGEKPFPCSYCSKAFTQKAHLNLHMRSHTGERPFRCKLCGLSFTQNRPLKVHMEAHAAEEVYQEPV